MLPCFAEFDPAGGLFGADIELFADALADFFPVAGVGAEVIG